MMRMKKMIGLRMMKKTESGFKMPFLNRRLIRKIGLKKTNDAWDEFPFKPDHGLVLGDGERIWKLCPSECLSFWV